MSTRQYGTVNSLASADPVEEHAGRPRHDTNATLRSHRSGFSSRSRIALRRELGEYSEQDPFLPPRSRSSSPSTASTVTVQPPRRGKLITLWLLPLMVLANLSRGMTMAPRIEVYTQISCDALYPGDSAPGGPSNVTSTPLPLTLRDFKSSSIFDSPQPLDLHILRTRGQNGVRAATPSEKCLHNPAVQSRAANIQATLGTIVGVLSIITAGYWGQISDAFGRKRTFTANLFGMTFHDIIYIAVSIPDSIFNRNAWGFLIIGPIVEGLLGGLTTLHAAENSYLADCAPPGSRSTIFAYYQGSSYISLALGPQLAGLFLHAAASEAGLPVFYLGLGLNILALCYATFILPETVTREMMHAARQPSETQSSLRSESDQDSEKDKWVRRIRLARRRLLAPLTMFGPRRRSGGGWDLNLMFLVIAQFTHLMSVGVVQVKFLYAQHTYAWSVKQLGYYISLLWTLRAFHLLLLLPTIVHFIKPRPLPSFSALQRLSQDLRFDYRIAQFSIFIDTTAYVLTLLAPAASQVLFVTFTSLSSFTAGVNPAIHSLAVSFLHARDNDANVGQMFGGMSMLQAIAHTMQPLLFGIVYSHTVATFPKAIFALAAGLLLASVALLTLLQTNQTEGSVEENAIQDDVDGEREDDQFDIGREGEEEGREGPESNKPLLGAGGEPSR